MSTSILVKGMIRIMAISVLYSKVTGIVGLGKSRYHA